MLSDLQLRNFRTYLRMVPPALQGVPRDRLSPAGAYDAKGGSPRHGIGARDFARGGAFDAEGGVGRDVVEQLLSFLKGKLEPADMQKLAGMLKATPDGEQATDGDDMAEKIARFCEAKGLSADDAGELVRIVSPDPGMAGDDPAPFKGMPTPGGKSYGADKMATDAQMEQFRREHGLTARSMKHVGYR